MRFCFFLCEFDKTCPVKKLNHAHLVQFGFKQVQNSSTPAIQKRCLRMVTFDCLTATFHLHLLSSPLGFGLCNTLHTVYERSLAQIKDLWSSSKLFSKSWDFKIVFVSVSLLHLSLWGWANHCWCGWIVKWNKCLWCRQTFRFWTRRTVENN